MTRLTIDRGIDLGTTNSVVAALDGTEVRILPDAEGRLITPSIVHIDNRGQVHVGEGAKHQDRANTALRFKRTMGQGEQATKLFEGSGRRMTPEQLSAEVLKELRGIVREQCGEELREVVITVPADFYAPQNEATRQAARLAGFRHCTLLLEPIAAALAYGFTQSTEDEFWMIYDFGGGTFDAAVVHMEEGEPSVVTHAGNNYLGGSDIDDDIVAKKMIPKLVADYNLSKFDPNSSYWRTRYALLLSAAEKAKIQVCKRQQPYSGSVCLADENGREIVFDFELKPDDVEEISRPYIAQSLDLCRRALSEKNVRPDRIAKILMVGGSTLSPWVRKAVQNEFKRPLEFGRNPMTVVAEGAAVFAGTIKMSEPDGMNAPGVYSLRITSPLMGENSRPPISGRVEAPAEAASLGITIEFIDEMSGWCTGRIEVRENGNFHSSLRAEPKKSTWFRVELRSADGSALPCVPDRLEYRCKGAEGDVGLTLTHAIGVCMADGRLDTILEKGLVLPTPKKTKVHRTVRALKRGSGNDAIRIPVYEGANTDRADRNSHVITLHVSNDRIARDLPIGSEVEILLECNRNHQLTGTAFIPIMEQSFPIVVELHGTVPPKTEIRTAFEKQQKRWEALLQDAKQHGNPGVYVIIKQIEEQEFSRQIQELLDRNVETSLLAKVDTLVRLFATKLDELADALEWPMLVQEAEQRLDGCRHALERAAGPRLDEYRRELLKIEQALQKIAGNGSSDVAGSSSDLRRRIADINRLFYRVTENDIVLWGARLAHMIELKTTLKDRGLAETLTNEGRKAFERNDVDAVRAIVMQLWNLQPEGVAVDQDDREKGDTIGDLSGLRT